ncbi:MAG: hypothetical protein H0W61_10150 [Bacteroidetes bacterium]|nr:hypothetical protein [Bacteroidota bacterium]
MTIVNKNNKIIITLDKGVDMDSIQKFIDYLTLKEIASKSKAKLTDAVKLIREIKKKRKVRVIY